MGEIRNSDDPTLKQTLQSAWISAQYAAGSKPMVFLDKTISGIRDWALRGARSKISPELDSSFVSTARDITAAPFKLFDFMAGKPGDQRLSASVEKSVEQFFNGGSRPQSHGSYDIYMAAGWEPKGPLKVNGVMVKDPKPVSNLLAVFVRDKDGNVELLDPTIKVTSIGELKSLPKAMWSSAPNASDRRWQETAGTFVEGQLAPLVAGAGVGALQKVLGGAAKGTRLAGLLEKGEATGARVGKALGTVGILSNAGDASDMVSGLSSGYMSQLEVRSLARGLLTVLTSKKDMTDQQLRDHLNGTLREYSYKDGANTQQIYIPSEQDTPEWKKGMNDPLIAQAHNPWVKFATLMEGHVLAYKRESSPWDDWKMRDIRLGEVQKAIAEDRGFNKAIVDLAGRALSGGQVSDKDIMLMRVYQNAHTLDNHVALFGKSGAGKISYTPDEREKTLKDFRVTLSQMLIEEIDRVPAKAKQYGVKSHAEFDYANQDDVVFDDRILLNFAKDHGKTLSKLDNDEMRQSLAKAGGPFAGLAVPDR